ncbi:MAG TPA: hypothetical protein VGM44_21000 [Polyangiaceae bacterium]
MGPLSKRFSGPGLALLLAACGGAEATDAPAKAPQQSHERAAADDSGEDDSPAEEDSAPPRSACDDGSCSPCGNGLCLTGWYCDESASGGPACSWLPQCAQKSSCGCVTSTLGSGCKCTEQSGGLHVTCK